MRDGAIRLKALTRREASRSRSTARSCRSSNNPVGAIALTLAFEGVDEIGQRAPPEQATQGWDERREGGNVEIQG